MSLVQDHRLMEANIDLLKYCFSYKYNDIHLSDIYGNSRKRHDIAYLKEDNVLTLQYFIHSPNFASCNFRVK